TSFPAASCAATLDGAGPGLRSWPKGLDLWSCFGTARAGQRTEGARMRTPRLVAAVATVMLAAGLSACGSDAEQGGAVEAADCTAITDGSADGEKLTVWIMEGTNPDATPFFDAVS